MCLKIVKPIRHNYGNQKLPNNVAMQSCSNVQLFRIKLVIDLKIIYKLKAAKLIKPNVLQKQP